MIKLFSSSAERQKKKNEKLRVRALDILDDRKAGFRENAISKLTFLYPDIVFAVSLHSANFAGYSKDRNQYIFGKFFDDFLPDSLDLQECVEEVDFEDRFIEFIQKVQNFTKPKDVIIDGEARQYRDTHFRYMIDTHGKNGYTLGDDRFFAYEARLIKNDKIFARSSVFSPKPQGYFAERVYRNIVQDITGPGVSIISLHILSTNWGAISETKIHFAYVDLPRKSEAQSRDHFIKVCSNFMPFLQAIEKNVTSSEIRDSIFSPREEDLNDRAIGLY